MLLECVVTTLEVREVFVDVGGVEGFVVLGGDAVPGELLGEGVEVRVFCRGAVVGPCGVDAELKVIAGESLGFDGLAGGVEDVVGGEGYGEFLGCGFASVVLQESVPGEVVAVG